MGCRPWRKYILNPASYTFIFHKPSTNPTFGLVFFVLVCAATIRIPALESRASRVTAGDGATRAVLRKNYVRVERVQQHANIQRYRQEVKGKGSGDVSLPAIDGIGGGANLNLSRYLAEIKSLITAFFQFNLFISAPTKGNT